MRKASYGILSFIVFFSQIAGAQYISKVWEYTPAPGQFTNDKTWGSPASAPSIIGGINGHLSLGSFGGYVIFQFEQPVENDPNNPYGVDFTIFGNALVSNIYHVVTWSEYGIVSVMKDENGNGKPDDTWYELAGSDYFFASTKKKYTVNYTNPESEEASDVPWTDNLGNEGVIFANNFHKQSYYPFADSFPHINPEKYTLSGTCLEADLDKSNPGYVMLFKKAFGYVDNQERRNAAATLLPDNPYTPAIAENSGGDAFDISWAVDESGNYVDLDQIHFVKVHNALLADAGWLGEASTEITGALDVAPEPSLAEPKDIIVIKNFPKTISPEDQFTIETAVFKKGRLDKEAKIQWSFSREGVSINENNQFEFTKPGKVIATASLLDKPSVSASDSVELLMNGENPTLVQKLQENPIRLFPNPAVDFLCVENAEGASIAIYNLTGCLLHRENLLRKKQYINLSRYPQGLYILRLRRNGHLQDFRFVKN